MYFQENLILLTLILLILYRFRIIQYLDHHTKHYYCIYFKTIKKIEIEQTIFIQLKPN